jgi:G:T-mismatch repair DNA endonuclease (very short patch repair protein)
MAREMTKAGASLELKLQANRRRDQAVNPILGGSGRQVVRIWEHEFKKPALVARRLLRVLKHRVQR